MSLDNAGVGQYGKKHEPRRTYSCHVFHHGQTLLCRVVRLSDLHASSLADHPSGAAAFPLIGLFRSTIQSAPCPQTTQREALSDAHTCLYRFPWHDTDAPIERPYCQCTHDYLFHIALLITADNPIYSCHPSLWLTEQTGPSGV
jgi:hypothetical protein